MKSLTVKNKEDYFKIDLTKKVGHPRKFATPNAMALLFNEYVQFIFDNNPEENVAFHYQGDITEHGLKKMRPLTLEGFCVYACTTLDTFGNYEKLLTTNKYCAEFLGLCTRIREIVWSHQYEGAAAGLLNPAIVARKLNIAEVTKGVMVTMPPDDFTKENVKKVNEYLEGKY